MLGVVGQQCCVRLHSGKATCKRKQHCWPTTPNIVGCYLLRPFGKPSCMLLGVVAQSLKPVKLSQPTTPNISFVPWPPKRSAIMLDPFAQLFQHCWGHARSLRMVYKELFMGCILPTMHCRSQNCWELLHPFAHYCQHARNNSQHC